MGFEIERKFLVDPDKWVPKLTNVQTIVQGYLSDNPESVVRVRTIEELQQGFITVKGITTGHTRQEFEYEIPFHEANAMLSLCNRIVSKTRFIEQHNDMIWEIDVFKGKDFIVAEVELEHAEQNVVPPEFLIMEVTGDPAYYNSNM